MNLLIFISVHVDHRFLKSNILARFLFLGAHIYIIYSSSLSYY